MAQGKKVCDRSEGTFSVLYLKAFVFLSAIWITVLWTGMSVRKRVGYVLM